MTDERDKPSGAKESSARNTARDVPFVRGAGSESEPAPRGQRPGQLPRDPTYEAELAQVGLAVLRDRDRRDDPSTKQGGRRGHEFVQGQPPESVTPESPGTRASREMALGKSPEPPSSGGRAVASGTLLSVGAVDPRGKTERTLETPRMFISEADRSREAYFKPGKIPAVTVHQTLETETVKLADSIDPRRAKTIPRLDRAALARLAPPQSNPDSDTGMALSEPESSLDVAASEASPRWNQREYAPDSSIGEHDGQIHASLSPFRDQGEPSFSLDGAETRPEPFAARRASDPPLSMPAPDTSTIPTHRDLPVHRIEASRPPPPPPASSPQSVPGDHFDSEGPRPTTASISVEEPEPRPVWLNYAAFAIALLLAIGLGLWLTSGSESRQASPNATPSASPVVVKRAEPIEVTPSPVAPDTADAVVAPAAPPAHQQEGVASLPKPSTVSTPESPKPIAAPLAPAAAPRKSVSSSPPKSSGETIF